MIYYAVKCVETGLWAAAWQNTFGSEKPKLWARKCDAIRTLKARQNKINRIVRRLRTAPELNYTNIDVSFDRHLKIVEFEVNERDN